MNNVAVFHICVKICKVDKIVLFFKWKNCVVSFSLWVKFTCLPYDKEVAKLRFNYFSPSKVRVTSGATSVRHDFWNFSSSLPITILPEGLS